MSNSDKIVAIVGTGITGIATAYYLAKNHGYKNLILIDRGFPMEFTSAQSGENYRNWWPNPVMVEFTNRSTDLLEEISNESNNRINMNRRGYVLASRETNIDALVSELQDGFGNDADALIMYHNSGNSSSYIPAIKPDWETAPNGVDIIQNQDLIRTAFPTYDHDLKTLIHIRRAGDISGQQLGMHMLEYLKGSGAKRVIGMVETISKGADYTIELTSKDGTQAIKADQIVNAAGPFANNIAKMLGVELPIYNTFQQKIAFEDTQNVIPRNMPFSMPGSIHCRPDGGDGGTWLKLGWAYNESPQEATWEPPLYENYPDIVLRGAARLNPALKAYYGRLPRNMHHYGGWYTMTEENWPLIGPMGPEGAFMNCALSGYGTMAACAGGELCAAWIAQSELPSYAKGFSLDRYQDESLMTALRNAPKGLL